VGIRPGAKKNFDEFYRGGEFGDYLEEFAAYFNLKECIRFGVELQQLERTDTGWNLLIIENGKEEHISFDAVFICTGLVNQKAPIGSAPIPITEDFESIRDATVVVVGGGESAADVANHLAKPVHNNRV